jgi:hypothetical protein
VRSDRAVDSRDEALQEASSSCVIGSATSILPVGPPAPKRSVSSTRRGRDLWPARNERSEVADVDRQPLDGLERRRVRRPDCAAELGYLAQQVSGAAEVENDFGSVGRTQVDLHEAADQDDRMVGRIAGPQQQLGPLPGPAVTEAQQHGPIGLLQRRQEAVI